MSCRVLHGKKHTLARTHAAVSQVAAAEKYFISQDACSQESKVRSQDEDHDYCNNILTPYKSKTPNTNRKLKTQDGLGGVVNENVVNANESEK